MKTKYFKMALCLGIVPMMWTSCSLDYEPISTPTELTEGTQTDTTTAVLKDKAAAES